MFKPSVVVGVFPGELAWGKEMPGRHLAAVVLNDEERTTLTALAGRRKTAQALAMRARIVLSCADGHHNAHPKAFTWIKTADDILAAIERFCIYNSPKTA